jgi:hypothetical protein
MTNLLRDVRHGIRALTTNPGVTSVIVAVLGIGIGANVSLFTVVDAAFLRPWAFPNPAASSRFRRLRRAAVTCPSHIRISWTGRSRVTRSRPWASPASFRKR